MGYRWRSRRPHTGMAHTEHGRRQYRMPAHPPQDRRGKRQGGRDRRDRRRIAATWSVSILRPMNSLGIDGTPATTRVVVAMSGGVDSSVAAGLLVREGYDVVGVTLQLYDHGTAVNRPGSCCAGQDIHDARRVADGPGIPHYVLDYEDRFRADVMEDFADTYLSGATPIPCVRCNQRVKFRDLLGTARDLGASALATGHYVRRVMGPHGAELHRAVDPVR